MRYSNTHELQRKMLLPQVVAQHTVTHCKTTETHRNTLQHTATHCNTLQQHCDNTCSKRVMSCSTKCSCHRSSRNTLQHTATTLQHTATTLQHTATTLQHTATHCNTLQHTATFCKTTATHRHITLQKHSAKQLQHTAATHCKSTAAALQQHLLKESDELQHKVLLQQAVAQHTATHCNAPLQHTTATHRRNTLPKRCNDIATTPAQRE